MNEAMPSMTGKTGVVAEGTISNSWIVLELDPLAETKKTLINHIGDPIGSTSERQIQSDNCHIAFPRPAA